MIVLWQMRKIGLGPIDKTVIKVFGLNVRDYDPEVVEGNSIKYIREETKYFGVWFNSRLTFDLHCKQGIARANQVLGALAVMNAKFPLLSCRCENRMRECMAFSRLWAIEFWFWKEKAKSEEFYKQRLRKMHGVSSNANVDAIRWIFGFLLVFAKAVMKGLTLYQKMWDKKEDSLEK